MGRKSLLTSTQKKKGAAKKKAAPAKSLKASETKKMSEKGTTKVARKAVSTKKATATSRATAKAKPAVEAKQKKAVTAKVKAAAKAKVKVAAKAAAKTKVEVKAPAKTKAKKAAAAKKPKVKIKDLLLKTFDVALRKQPAVGRPKAGKAPAKLPEAPPFVSGRNKKETERIRALLFKGFDLKDTPRAEEVKKKVAAKPKAKAKGKPKDAAAAKKPKVKLKDLLLKKFAVGLVKQPVAVGPKAGKAPAKLPEAPPFVSGQDKKETERIRALLFQQFDLKAGAKKEKAKGAAPISKARASLKDLLFKKFETVWAKGALKPVSYEREAALKLAEAPPFVAGSDEKETKRLRALLLKPFDLKAEPPREEISKAAPGEAVTRPPSASAVSAKGEPTDWMTKGCLWGLGILLAIIVVASFSNRADFYLEDADGAVQVWQGRFAPLGKELVATIDGIEKTSLPAQEVYSKKEIYPILFRHLQDKADAALNDPRGPDLGAMKSYLQQAAAYAPSMEARRRVELHLKNIDFMVLYQKADLALSKGTPADLKAAKGYLDKANSYATRDYQRELIRKTKAAVGKAAAALKGR